MPHSGRRIDRQRLFGSKWTALAPRDRDKHFEVVEARRDGAVVLECVLSGRRREVALDDLRERAAWQPGWR